LIDARHDGERIAQYLLNTLAKQGDVLKVTLPEKHPLRKVAPHQRISHQHPILSPVTRLTRWPEFEAWLASKSGSFRKGLRYDRKKLAELGPLRLLDGGGADDQTYRVIDWMFEEKRAWLSRKGVASLWITDERSPELLRTLFRQALPSASGVELWALLVDEIPAAGAICLVSNTAVELFMFVMNPTFAARSPGNLLLEDIAKSAAKRHKDFDFRIGSSDYKARWADDTIYYQTLVVALTWKGCIGALEAETHARNIAFRVWAKREARSLLNRLRPRSGA
jgi:CelD/BcsL family acetyltransferase involved in cellulose biosynthesis